MKRVLERRRPPTQAAPGNIDASEADDAAIFRAAIRDAQPLAAAPRVAVVRPATMPATIAVPRSSTDAAVAPDRGEVYDTPPGPDATDLPGFARPGQSSQVLRRLRRGHWPVARELDLHGARRDEARAAIARCIAEALERGIRCVRIVHGRGLRSPGGEAVLRDVTRQWLASCPDVLAFCEAPPAQGGSGALLALLRRA